MGDCTAHIPPACDERKKHCPLRPFPELENVTKNDAVIHSCKECEEGKECMYDSCTYALFGLAGARFSKEKQIPFSEFFLCSRRRQVLLFLSSGL